MTCAQQRWFGICILKTFQVGHRIACEKLDPRSNPSGQRVQPSVAREAGAPLNEIPLRSNARLQRIHVSKGTVREDCVILGDGQNLVPLDGEAPQHDMGERTPETAGRIIKIAGNQAVFFQGLSLRRSAIVSGEPANVLDRRVSSIEAVQAIRASIEVYDVDFTSHPLGPASATVLSSLRMPGRPRVSPHPRQFLIGRRLSGLCQQSFGKIVRGQRHRIYGLDVVASVDGVVDWLTDTHLLPARSQVARIHSEGGFCLSPVPTFCRG